MIKSINKKSGIDDLRVMGIEGTGMTCLSNNQKKLTEQLSSIDLSPENYLAATVIGIEKAGKTYLGEAVSCMYYQTGKWIPLIINAEHEEAVWRIIPENNTYIPIVLIVPPYVKYKIPEKYSNRIIFVSSDEKDYLTKAYKHASGKVKRMVVLASWLFDDDHYFDFLANMLRYDIREVSESQDMDWFVDICEAGDLAPQSLNEYDGSKETKKALMTFSRKKRHNRCSYLIENQSYKILKEVRDKMNLWFIKKSPEDFYDMKSEALPKCIKRVILRINSLHEEFKGTKSYMNICRNRPKVNALHTNEYYAIRSSAMSVDKQYWKGTIPLLPWHHKRPQDSLRRDYGIHLMQDIKKLKEFTHELSKRDVAWLTNYVSLVNALCSKHGMDYKQLSKLTGKDQSFISVTSNRYPSFFK